MTAITSFGGYPVVESNLLPTTPSNAEDARRIVRHGLADVLERLGEEVGPKPGALTHLVVAGDGTGGTNLTLFASAEWVDKIRALAQVAV